MFHHSNSTMHTRRISVCVSPTPSALVLQTVPMRPLLHRTPVPIISVAVARPPPPFLFNKPRLSYVGVQHINALQTGVVLCTYTDTVFTPARQPVKRMCTLLWKVREACSDTTITICTCSGCAPVVQDSLVGMAAAAVRITAHMTANVTHSLRDQMSPLLKLQVRA